MKIAIIPARGGSKRIPKKNIKDFGGKPMIASAIGIAQQSGLFDHIVVSSDDSEIIKISNDWGAETPFIRPKDLADDITPTVPVIAHAIEECQALGWPIEFACCIYPAVPLLDVNYLINAYELLVNSKQNFTYPVIEYPHPIQRAMRQLPSGQMQFLNDSNELVRTQDLEITYHDAGQFYWGKLEAWIQHRKIHTDGLGMVIPNWRVVDIDNLDDWKRAELLSAVITKD